MNNPVLIPSFRLNVVADKTYQDHHDKPIHRYKPIIYIYIYIHTYSWYTFVYTRCTYYWKDIYYTCWHHDLIIVYIYIYILNNYYIYVHQHIYFKYDNTYIYVIYTIYIYIYDKHMDIHSIHSEHPFSPAPRQQWHRSPRCSSVWPSAEPWGCPGCAL